MRVVVVLWVVVVGWVELKCVDVVGGDDDCGTKVTCGVTTPHRIANSSGGRYCTVPTILERRLK